MTPDIWTAIAHIREARPRSPATHTNALQDRFGLSDEPAQRLMAFLANPPSPVQPSQS